MSVYKRLPPGVLPDVMLIGSHQIQAKDLFNALLNRYAFEAGSPSRTMRETFRITTATGQMVGEVKLFIRVSCFGKKIVTQFQIPHNKKPFLFKGIADNCPVYQCKKLPSGMKIDKPKIPKCACARETEENSRGSGEPRTCCPTTDFQQPFRSHAANNKQQDFGPRPCCPSLRCPPDPCPTQSNFGHSGLPTFDLFHSTASTNRKCGCPVKEEKGCNCCSK